MSKVKSIKKSIVPYLNNIFEDKLIYINHSWYVDNKQNLYKLKIFEDGYLISNESEFPEEIKKLPSDKTYDFNH